ncbi:2-oxo acid dehydrogenase subunit E2 [Streptomyces sp. NPDC014864]|uniref:2-oxo acid dehydrogenase subunit E2 n=1 Tax=Streptomyces sp. NPDC014864 TaxID=3364924 RepID=UPI0037030917
MAEFTMPSLGADMEEGVLQEWFVGPGDQVTKGDVVAVVETDKAAIEVECFASGTVGRLLVEPGTRVPVGTPLALIESEAPTPAPSERAAARPEPAAAEAEPAKAAPHRKRPRRAAPAPAAGKQPERPAAAEPAREPAPARLGEPAPAVAAYEPVAERATGKRPERAAPAPAPGKRPERRAAAPAAGRKSARPPAGPAAAGPVREPAPAPLGEPAPAAAAYGTAAEPAAGPTARRPAAARRPAPHRPAAPLPTAQKPSREAPGPRESAPLPPEAAPPPSEAEPAPLPPEPAPLPPGVTPSVPEAEPLEAEAVPSPPEATPLPPEAEPLPPEAVPPLREPEPEETVVGPGPLVRHLAEDRGVDLTSVHGTGRGGRITRADVEHAVAGDRTRVRATPYARRLARDLGVDLAGLHGTGDAGAVRAADVHEAVAARRGPATGRAARVATEPRPAREPVAAPPEGRGDKRAETMRRAIGDLMSRSKREIPHYYLSTTVDMAAAEEWLRHRNRGRPPSERLVSAALLLKAAALAAHDCPRLNGFWRDGGFVPGAGVHLGVAVSLRDGGLLAPVIHDADTLPPADLMTTLRDLVQRARLGRLRGSEMSGATLTVTSLGDQGVEAVFGVIHPPQVALVGFGTVVERPWATGGLLGVRPVVTATLSADHRATDGAAGARYLTAVDRLLQRPEEL